MSDSHIRLLRAIARHRQRGTGTAEDGAVSRSEAQVAAAQARRRRPGRGGRAARAAALDAPPAAAAD
jgi:hypothetical protein